MTEVLRAQVPALRSEAGREETETRVDNKTKMITAAAIGAAGLAAAYAESKGLIKADWPIPMHSFKHPWIGYYAAWTASRLKRSDAAAAAAAAAANCSVESLQDAAMSHDHFPFHWLEIHNYHRMEGNEDNAADLALCMGGAALFLAQNNHMFSRAKSRLSQVFTRNPRPAADTIS